MHGDSFVASDPQSRETIEVGATLITLPDKAGARAQQWARALPSLNYISDPPFELVIEAIIQDARNNLALQLERKLVEEIDIG